MASHDAPHQRQPESDDVRIKPGLQDIANIESDVPGSGELSPPGLDDDMDFERRNPGSGGDAP